MGREETLSKRVDAALGRIPCDLLIKGVQYLDVFNLTWVIGDVAIIDGFIVGTDSGLKAKREIDGRKKFLVPGFIDAHVHLESSLMTPGYFEQTVLLRGTTTAICDPHELTNVHGTAALEYFFAWSDVLSLDLKVMLSSCIPSTSLETNGAGVIGSAALKPFQSRRQALGLAEMMNVPGVLNHEPDVLEKLADFEGKRIDGHAPLLRGLELSAYLSTGISSCHESTEAEEAREKLSKGMAVWIREGSVAKDLKVLAPLLSVANSPMMGFCSDDRNVADILREGHIDHLLREAIKLGQSAEVVYRAASWSVARHYGMTRKGGIAPGYEADLVLLGDRDSVAIESVFRRGKMVGEGGNEPKVDTVFGNSMKVNVPEESELKGPVGKVHIIGIQPGKILTEHLVDSSGSPGVARLTVLERYGHGGRPANGYVYGFGKSFEGAIASSVGHDSHNLIVAGTDVADMRVALKSLIESGGGFAVVKNKKVLAQLSLPVGGLMSRAQPKEIEQALESLYQASRSVGCELEEPFLQLAFLSLPVIPHLKLTDKGLVDVDRFQIISVDASEEGTKVVSRSTT